MSTTEDINDHLDIKNPEAKKHPVCLRKNEEIINTLDNTNKKLLYHGTANVLVGDFSVQKSNTSPVIFLTDSINFANAFSFGDENRPNGVTYETLVDLGKIFDANSDEDIQKLRPLVSQLVKQNYAYEPTGLHYKTDREVIFTAGNQIKDPSHEDWVDHYMWRAKSNWRLLETPEVTRFLQDNGYNSFSMKERGATTYGIFDINRVNFRSYTDTSGKKIQVY